MKNMTLGTIAAVCGGTYFAAEESGQKEIKGVVTDSGQVEKDYLFVAIKGARVDGHQFIPDAFAKGALAVLSEHKLEHPAGSYILVESTVEAMKQLAAFYRRSLSVKVVGITGSVGKTSTKEMIASVLGQRFCVLKTEGNRNNGIGLPLTIFQIREEHEVAVLEMGISEFGEMHRLAEMANPDICVITNIGTCHLEGLHDRDGILRAKTECFDHMKDDGIAVLNGDDDKLGTIKTVNGRLPVFYGMYKEAAVGDTPTGYQALPEKSVYASDVEVRALAGTKAVIHIAAKEDADTGRRKETVIPVEIPIAGEHNVYNALAAAAVAVHLGLSADEIRRGIESVQTISGRSNLICKDGITVIDDCYNANPDSMKASVNVLSNAPGRKIAVLGDMGELGKEERALHYMVGEHFAGKGIDALFCTGTLSREIAAAVHKNSTGTQVREFDAKEELTEALQRYKREGDTILVKASHFMGFSEIVKRLTE